MRRAFLAFVVGVGLSSPALSQWGSDPRAYYGGGFTYVRPWYQPYTRHDYVDPRPQYGPRFYGPSFIPQGGQYRYGRDNRWLYEIGPRRQGWY